MKQCLLFRERLPHAMYWPSRTFTCLVFLVCTFVSHAQETISGRVTSNDTALAGVTVKVKGTTTATATDQSGNFRIAASPGSTLVFSSVGYAQQEVPVNNQTVISVHLQATTAEM